MPMATSSTRWQQLAFLGYSMHREKNYPDQGEHYDYQYEEPDAAPDARVLHVLLLSGNDSSRGLRYALASDATSPRHLGSRIASEIAPSGRVNRVQERGSALGQTYPLSSTGASACSARNCPVRCTLVVSTMGLDQKRELGRHKGRVSTFSVFQKALLYLPCAVRNFCGDISGNECQVCVPQASRLTTDPFQIPLRDI
jgi:hypothetical protein